jgi:transposase
MPGDYVSGAKRDQSILFPDTLDEYVTEENPVRFIDAFVDSLDLEKLGFKHAKLDGGAGRPPYDPADLLKLYVYGYLNQVRSSRKLEKACVSNLEMIWLMKRLAPDFKTIADFRKDNVDCIKPVFKEFVFLCRSLDLFGAELVGIDGTKFKAVNSRNRNFNEKTLAERSKRVEERIVRYLKELEENDRSEEGEKSKDDGAKVERLKGKIHKLDEKRQLYLRVREQMKKETGKKEISLTDPESRLMRVSNQNLDVCYNAHTAVDSKNKMIAEYDVTNSASDMNALSGMAKCAKNILAVERLEVTADRGFHNSIEIKECVENGITPYVPEPSPPNPNKRLGVPAPEFYENRFTYDAEKDAYTCPAGNEMTFWKRGQNNSGKKMRLYRTQACDGCPFRSRCTTNRRGRIIYRWVHEEVLDEMRARLRTEQGRAKVVLRAQLVEHPFGTMKRVFNQGYLLLKGLKKVRGELGLTMLAYNLRRAINILGTKRLIDSIAVS